MTPKQVYARVCWWAHLSGVAECEIWKKAYRDSSNLPEDIVQRDVEHHLEIFYRSELIPLFVIVFAKRYVLPKNLVIDCNSKLPRTKDILRQVDKEIKRMRAENSIFPSVT